MDAAFEHVVASYHRARESGQLFDTFYRRFLEKSPDIPSMFARTDFPHQKLMLRESILEMLLFAQTGSGLAEIELSAKADDGYCCLAPSRDLNVTPEHCCDRCAQKLYLAESNATTHSTHPKSPKSCALARIRCSTGYARSN